MQREPEEKTLPPQAKWCHGEGAAQFPIALRPSFPTYQSLASAGGSPTIVQAIHAPSPAPLGDRLGTGKGQLRPPQADLK